MSLDLGGFFMNRINIIIADDHHLFRRSTVELLEASSSEINFIAEAENGLEATILSAQLTPDVVLMDLSMPTMDGLEATHKIKQEMPRVKIVIFSAINDYRSIYQALCAGADAYLSKNLPSGEVVAVIKEVFLEQIPFNRVMANAITSMDEQGMQDFKESKILIEHPEDQELVDLIKLGMNYGEIAKELSLSETRVKEDFQRILQSIRS